MNAAAGQSLKRMITATWMPQKLFAELDGRHPTLAEELRLVYREALIIWGEPQPGYIRPFTVHAGPHIDQVEANLDALTRALQKSSFALSPEEIFVLLGACYLHDIGMLLEVPDARARHAEYAYELILNSYAATDIAQRRVTLPIRDQNARETIARIARAHWTDFAKQLPPEAYIYENVKGRMRLLGTLLATADLLDLSPVRAWRFRTIHRLSELPPVSELHQVAHARVRGFEILAPNPKIHNELQFQLTWRDDSDSTFALAEWINRWLSSQWRQLQPLLNLDSNGQIRWTTPWVSMSFEAPQGAIPPLSSESLQILRAESMEQQRINREEFARECDEAMKAGNSHVYVLPVRPELDGKHLCEWFEAWARIRPSCLVARTDISPTAAVEIASLVATVMEQWGEHLHECTDSEALNAFSDFTINRNDTNIVLVIVAEQFDEHLFGPVLHRFFAHLPARSGARILVLATESTVAANLFGVDVVQVAQSPIPQHEVEVFLQGKLGFSPDDASAIWRRMSSIGIQTQPGFVYSYIDAHCT